MLRVRRLYFYLISYLSLAMLIGGLTTLSRVFIERALEVDSSGVLGALRLAFAASPGLPASVSISAKLDQLAHS